MARHILLEIANNKEADQLVADILAHPGKPLLSPVQENEVHVQVIFPAAGYR